MELKPHYLARIRNVDDLVTDQAFPRWVTALLARTPFVVVRRAEHRNGYAPVGIRGDGRGQRSAAWLSVDKAIEVVPPFFLVHPAKWKPGHRTHLPAIRSLQLITPLLQQTGYNWGPTGSTGFELATGMPAVKEESDLDLVIDLPEKLSVDSARSLLKELDNVSLVSLDIQMNTPAGGVSLLEYAQSEIVLIKTVSGPVLQYAYSLWC